MEETLRLVAVFLGSFLPVAVGVGLLLWRVRGLIGKFITALEKPANKVEENTLALNGVASALNVMTLFNSDLRADLLTAKKDREELTRRIESYADTVEELLTADKQRFDETQRRAKEMKILLEEVAAMNVELTAAKKSLKDCQDGLAKLNTRDC